MERNYVIVTLCIWYCWCRLYWAFILIQAPPNESFFGPTGVQNLNGISIGSAVFAQLIIVSNRQTDRNRQTDHAVSIATCDMLFLHEYIWQSEIIRAALYVILDYHVRYSGKNNTHAYGKWLTIVFNQNKFARTLLCSPINWAWWRGVCLK